MILTFERQMMNCSYVALVPHISYMGEKENALFFGRVMRNIFFYKFY